MERHPAVSRARRVKHALGSSRACRRWVRSAVPGSSGPGAGSTGVRAQDPTESADPVVVRVGVLKPGGGYTVTSMPIETYVARVLAGEAVRDSQPAALEALAITIRTFAAGEPRAAPRRRVRSVRSDALSGGASGGGGDRARRAGDGRALLLLRNGVAGFDLLHGVVRRPHRDAVGRLARRRGSARSCRRAQTTPAKARRRGRRASAKRICCGRCAPAGFAAIAARRPHRVAQRVGPRGAADARRIAARTRSPARICASSSAARSAGSTSRARRSTCGVRATRIASPVMGRATASACASSARRSWPSGERRPPRSSRSTFRASRFPDCRLRRHRPSVPGRTTASGMEVMVSLPDDDEGERAAIVRDTARARDEVARALGVAPPAARDAAVSSDHGRLREGDRPALVYLGDAGPRRNPRVAAGDPSRSRSRRSHDPPRAGPSHDRHRAGAAAGVGS